MNVRAPSGLLGVLLALASLLVALPAHAVPNVNWEVDFGGTVTQVAPTGPGALFGVSVGDAVSGTIIWQFPPGPFPPTPVTITTFDTAFKIGNTTLQQSVVSGGFTGTEFVSFSGGLLDDLFIEFPRDPLELVNPTTILENGVFYTEVAGAGELNPCVAGATCGVLFFADDVGVPHIVATPAPASSALLGLGLVTLILLRRLRSARR